MKPWPPGITEGIVGSNPSITIQMYFLPFTEVFTPRYVPGNRSEALVNRQSKSLKRWTTFNENYGVEEFRAIEPDINSDNVAGKRIECLWDINCFKLFMLNSPNSTSVRVIYSVV